MASPLLKRSRTDWRWVASSGQMMSSQLIISVASGLRKLRDDMSLLEPMEVRWVIDVLDRVVGSI
jgi:hypothetical protein